jgi:RHS repeat-associated protein
MYQFTGQRREAGLGLYFYQARWYDPVVGRFLQADTIVPELGDPQSLNRYTYAKNSPLVYNDPTGHIAWFVPLITGAVGAGTGFIGSVGGQMLGAEGSFQDRLNSVNWKSVGVAAGVGFVAGAAAPFTAATALGAAVTSAVAGGAQYALTQGVNNERIDPGDFVFSVGIGAVAGRISGPVSTSARAATYEATSRWLDRRVVRAIVDEGIAETAVKGSSLARSATAGFTSNAPTAPIKRIGIPVWNRLRYEGDSANGLRIDDRQPISTPMRHGGYQAE